MELWQLWTHSLEAALALLAVQLGLSEALCIIALTLIVRAALMPVSLAAAYRQQMNKQALARLQPQLDELKLALKGQHAELARQTMALHRQHGIAMFDRLTLFNLFSQGLFGIGLFQVLRRAVFSSKFLWIANLGRPDLWLTVLVTLLMLLGMALMPGATSDTSLWLVLAIPVVISVVAVAALPSALGLYWATSNGVTVVQALALRGLLARHRPAAA